MTAPALPARPPARRDDGGVRADMGLPLPCRLADGVIARRGDYLALIGDSNVLHLAVDGDGEAVVGWASEPLDAARCDRVDLDAMTGAVAEALS